MSRPVVAEPLRALPFENGRQVRDATELFLGGKRIERLPAVGDPTGFDRFPQLDTLWLPNNAIQELTGLDNCFRLRRLYVSDNRLASLKGSSLPFLRFLEELDLSRNNISGLEDTLAILTKLQYVKRLWLTGNPVASEVGYRARLLAALPSVEILDDCVVTPEERAAAAATAAAMEARAASPVGRISSPSRLQSRGRPGGVAPESPPRRRTFKPEAGPPLHSNTHGSGRLVDLSDTIMLRDPNLDRGAWLAVPEPGDPNDWRVRSEPFTGSNPSRPSPPRMSPTPGSRGAVGSRLGTRSQSRAGQRSEGAFSPGASWGFASGALAAGDALMSSPSAGGRLGAATATLPVAVASSVLSSLDDPAEPSHLAGSEGGLRAASPTKAARGRPASRAAVLSPGQPQAAAAAGRAVSRGASRPPSRALAETDPLGTALRDATTVGTAAGLTAVGRSPTRDGGATSPRPFTVGGGSARSGPASPRADGLAARVGFGTTPTERRLHAEAALVATRRAGASQELLRGEFTRRVDPLWAAGVAAAAEAEAAALAGAEGVAEEDGGAPLAGAATRSGSGVFGATASGGGMGGGLPLEATSAVVRRVNEDLANAEIGARAVRIAMESRGAVARPGTTPASVASRLVSSTTTMALGSPSTAAAAAAAGSSSPTRGAAATLASTTAAALAAVSPHAQAPSVVALKASMVPPPSPDRRPRGHGGFSLDGAASLSPTRRAAGTGVVGHAAVFASASLTSPLAASASLSMAAGSTRGSSNNAGGDGAGANPNNNTFAAITAGGGSLTLTTSVGTTATVALSKSIPRALLHNTSLTSSPLRASKHTPAYALDPEGSPLPAPASLRRTLPLVSWAAPPGAPPGSSQATRGVPSPARGGSPRRLGTTWESQRKQYVPDPLAATVSLFGEAAAPVPPATGGSVADPALLASALGFMPSVASSVASSSGFGGGAAEGSTVLAPQGSLASVGGLASLVASGTVAKLSTGTTGGPLSPRRPGQYMDLLLARSGVRTGPRDAEAARRNVEALKNDLLRGAPPAADAASDPLAPLPLGAWDQAAMLRLLYQAARGPGLASAPSPRPDTASETNTGASSSDGRPIPADAPPTQSFTVTRAQARAALVDAVVDLGLVPVVLPPPGKDGSVPAAPATASSRFDRSAWASTVERILSLVDPAHADAIPALPLLMGLESGSFVQGGGASLVKLPRVRWRAVTQAEAASAADARFGDAAASATRSRQAKPEDPAKPVTHAEAVAAAHAGTRLANVAALLEGRYDPPPPSDPIRPHATDVYTFTSLAPGTGTPAIPPTAWYGASRSKASAFTLVGDATDRQGLAARLAAAEAAGRDEAAAAGGAPAQELARSLSNPKWDRYRREKHLRSSHSIVRTRVDMKNAI